ncbi:MAG: hypothetical protein EXS06_11485 [Planctomycetaceae bacterium]|nr:hypothetical protein [Planctomycetaceae bacterium]
MMPFHDAWPWALGCAVVAAVSLLFWSQAAQRAFLVAMTAALVGGVGCLLADWLVVTDREQIEILFPRLARAAETGDTEAILAALDPSLSPLRSEAERALREFRPEEVRITRLDVTLRGPAAARLARAEMLIHTRGDARGAGGASGPVSALIDLKVDLRKQEGQFLITDFEADAARPMDRRRPE